MNWGDSSVEDPKRWILGVSDTGPGFPTDSGKPLAAALDAGSEPAAPVSPTAEGASMAGTTSIIASETSPAPGEPGEGIGLSIVKRLCEMLDATIEMQSVVGVGTSFRVFFPRHYNG